MSDNSADQLNRKEAENPAVDPAPAPQPENDPFAGGVENTPSPPRPDGEAWAHNIMAAMERMLGIVTHLQQVVPAAGGLGAQINALIGHVTAARAAITPPVEVPPAPEPEPETPKE